MSVSHPCAPQVLTPQTVSRVPTCSQGAREHWERIAIAGSDGTPSSVLTLWCWGTVTTTRRLIEISRFISDYECSIKRHIVSPLIVITSLILY
jgi:hypothetical protein